MCTHDCAVNHNSYLESDSQKSMQSCFLIKNYIGLTNLKTFNFSLRAGYANFGSDIGGYRRGPGKLGRTKELFIRWAQLGAFSPLMENGGDKEHRPWKFDNNNETLNIYKK